MCSCLMCTYSIVYKSSTNNLNRFVDCDMFMRVCGGGVGHLITRGFDKKLLQERHTSHNHSNDDNDNDDNGDNDDDSSGNKGTDNESTSNSSDDNDSDNSNEDNTDHVSNGSESQSNKDPDVLQDAGFGEF